MEQIKKENKIVQVFCTRASEVHLNDSKYWVKMFDLGFFSRIIPWARPHWSKYSSALPEVKKQQKSDRERLSCFMPLDAHLPKVAHCLNVQNFFQLIKVCFKCSVQRHTSYHLHPPPPAKVNKFLECKKKQNERGKRLFLGKVIQSIQKTVK